MKLQIGVLTAAAVFFEKRLNMGLLPQCTWYYTIQVLFFLELHMYFILKNTIRFFAPVYNFIHFYFIYKNGNVFNSL